VIRAFIAINIDPRIIREISAAIVQLRLAIPEVRWVAPDNIHLTLKFLGDIEPSQVDPIANALEQALKLFPRFTINAKGLGVFPDEKRPRVLWVGLEGIHLAALASTVETALEPLGFEPEPRGFKPHLTVGRWRQSAKAPAGFGEELGRWRAHAFGQFDVTDIILFQSMLRPQGAIHQPLKTIALGNREPLK